MKKINKFNEKYEFKVILGGEISQSDIYNLIKESKKYISVEEIVNSFGFEGEKYKQIVRRKVSKLWKYNFIKRRKLDHKTYEYKVILNE